MALTATQRAFLTSRLRITARPKGRNDGLKPTTPKEQEDAALTLALDKFLEQERAVLELLRQLEAWPLAKAQRLLLEAQVTAIRQPVTTVERGGSAEALAIAERALQALVAPLRTTVAAAGGAASARKAALAALENAKPQMADVDIGFVNVQWLEAADSRCAEGQWLQAMVLLDKVAPHCAAAKQANLKGSAYAAQLGTLDKLIKHPQHAAFASEIEHLGRLVSVIKSNLALNATATLDYDVGLIDLYGTKYLGFANAHDVAIKERDRLALLLTGLRQSPLVTANPALVEDLLGVDEQLERAQKQADKRLYEAAKAALTKAAELLGQAGLRKTEQQAWVTELQRVAPLLAKLERDVKAQGGPPSAPLAVELADIQKRMNGAQQLAGEGREVKAATTWLTEIGGDIERAQTMVENARELTLQASAVIEQLADDPAKALETARKLFEALKTRRGYQGIAARLGEIERKLTEAAGALKG